MLQIKIIIALLSFIGIGSGIFYINKLIGDNAVLEASLASTTAAFGNYATNVESEVDAYAQAAQILSEKYQLARDERDAKIKRITKADFTKMATRHPDMLSRRINAGTQRMFDELEAASRGSRRAKDAATAEAGADDVNASELVSD